MTRLERTVEGRTAADGTTESWTYDGEGNCTSHTDATGGVSRFEYTHFDLLTARTGPDGVRYAFDHDLELRLTKVTNPQGLTWTYAYDLGQVTRKEASGQVTTFTYDMTDQLAQATGPDGTGVTLPRDRLGRLRSETANGRTLTYRYDESGRRTGRTTPTGAVTTWSYDAAGNQTSASWPASHPGEEATGDREYTGTRITRAGRVRYEHDALRPAVRPVRTSNVSCRRAGSTQSLSAIPGSSVFPHRWSQTAAVDSRGCTPG